MTESAVIEAVHGLSAKIDALKSELRREMSPWMDAEETAAYMGISLSQVYLLKNKGVLKEFAVPGTTVIRMHRKQVDEAMMKADLPKSRRGRTAKPTISRRPPADDGSEKKPEETK